MNKYRVRDNESMYRDLKKTVLLGIGTMRVFREIKNPIPVVPFSDDVVVNFLANRFSPVAQIDDFDMYILKEYSSYLIFKVGQWRLALTLEENIDFLNAVIATKKIGIVRRESDLETKSGRRKYMKVFRLSTPLAKRLYDGYLLFKDKLSRDYEIAYKEKKKNKEVNDFDSGQLVESDGERFDTSGEA